MTSAEAEMLALNFIGLESVDLRGKYHDESVTEVLESEFGTSGRYMVIDETLSVDDIHGRYGKGGRVK